MYALMQRSVKAVGENSKNLPLPGDPLPFFVQRDRPQLWADALCANLGAPARIQKQLYVSLR